jgi:hypothetical protein
MGNFSAAIRGPQELRAAERLFQPASDVNDRVDSTSNAAPSRKERALQVFLAVFSCLQFINYFHFGR